MSVRPPPPSSTKQLSSPRASRSAVVRTLFIAAGLFASAAGVAQAVTIPTVPVGNPGNAPDPTTGFGSVSYEYSIGQTEVTNAQYAAFLNAVAQTDTNSLYHSNMAGFIGGITRSGSDGSYTYATISGRENNPVNWVNFWDATRFANWLHNGQPSGPQNNSTTEDGAYTLTPGGITANTITRNPSARWAISSEDEWYKAAYHQPASQGGDSDNYWRYTNSSNTVTTIAQANIFGAGINNTTPGGSYAANFYGAFDMGGNVWEWNETIIFNTDRIIRGGSFVDNGNPLGSLGFRINFGPLNADNVYGFRVSQIPGPSAAGLLVVGGLVMAGWRRRRSRG